jgi:hypothetical protein
MDLTIYRRIYPKLRLSWSLYQKFVHKDLMGVFDYLTDKQYERTGAILRGTDIHKKIELEGIKKVAGLEKLIDVSLDYKVEDKIVLEREKYQIVCQPDLYNEELVIDWKSGLTGGYEQQLQLYMWAIGEKCLTGYLVPVGENEKGVFVKRGVKQYARSKYASDWEYKFDTIAQEITGLIQKGFLERYLLENLL